MTVVFIKIIIKEGFWRSMVLIFSRFKLVIYQYQLCCWSIEKLWYWSTGSY